MRVKSMLLFYTNCSGLTIHKPYFTFNYLCLSFLHFYDFHSVGHRLPVLSFPTHDSRSRHTTITRQLHLTVIKHPTCSPPSTYQSTLTPTKPPIHPHIRQTEHTSTPSHKRQAANPPSQTRRATYPPSHTPGRSLILLRTPSSLPLIGYVQNTSSPSFAFPFFPSSNYLFIFVPLLIRVCLEARTRYENYTCQFLAFDGSRCSAQS